MIREGTSSAPVATEAPAQALPRVRFASVDILRGLAMVVMVLDHTRDFAHAESFQFDPADIELTTPAIFLTRWITHFVAPIFVLLAGTSARFQVDGGRSRGTVARFLVLRGLLLIALELTVVRLGIWFNADPSFLGMLQVIWVLGVAMIVLAALLFLPDALIAAFGIALIAGHNLLDGIQAPPDQQLLWAVLHQRANLAIFSTAGPDLLVLYPLIPWIGVMAVGYVLGRAYRWDAARRRPVLIGLGIALTVAWVAVRALNDYGDPVPWRSFADPVRTAMAFLNAEKYPPSLDFLLMTLGPALLLLGMLDGASQAGADAASLGARLRLGGARWFATLGGVPLFFYLGQWFVAHGLAVLAEALAGQDVAWQFMRPLERFAAIPPDAGFPLPVVYLLWLTAIAILAPICRWYRSVRANRGGILHYL